MPPGDVRGQLFFGMLELGLPGACVKCEKGVRAAARLPGSPHRPRMPGRSLNEALH